MVPLRGLVDVPIDDPQLPAEFTTTLRLYGPGAITRMTSLGVKVNIVDRLGSIAKHDSTKSILHDCRPNGFVAGMYDKAARQLFLKTLEPHVIRHELGHVFDHVCSLEPSKFLSDDDPRWVAICKAGPGITAYGQRNNNERFAESVATYLANIDSPFSTKTRLVLRANDRAAYSYILHLFCTLNGRAHERRRLFSDLEFAR